ncbi:MAG: 30S ribosomal protein S6 [Candidatus Eisenbacteria bacterium]
MREYETVICVRTDLDESEQEKEVRTITDLITEKGGEIVMVDPWGRRRLAYEVDKHNEGVYTLVRYHGTNEILNELERRFRINENLLRHLTVVAEGPLPVPQAEGEESAAGADEDGDGDDSADQAD